MTPKKATFAMLGVLAATIILGGVAFYFSDGVLTDKSEEIADLKADEEILIQQISTYEAARQKVEELSFVNELAEKVLPQEKDQSVVVAELTLFADEVGATIQQIGFNATDTQPGPTSQTEAAEGLVGVRIFPVNVSFAAGTPYDTLLAYLDKVETNRRKMQVVNVSLAPDSENGALLASAALTINLFLKP